jgi:hypothetical protein
MFEVCPLLPLKTESTTHTATSLVYLVYCIGLSFTMVLLDVIPAQAGIQVGKTGFRIKSGMTEVVKGLLRHYTRGRGVSVYIGTIVKWSLFTAVRSKKYLTSAFRPGWKY